MSPNREYAYVMQPSSVTVHFSDGEAFTWPSTHADFDKVKDAIRSGAPESELRTLFDTVKRVKDALSGALQASEGSITVTRDGVLYKGTPLHMSVTDRIQQHIAEGFDVKPLMRFLNKLMKNPRRSAVLSLYDFIEQNEVAITPDGDFIAYKRIRENYTDIHTGRFSNKVGDVVAIEPNQVDEDRDNVCSNGLHVCSRKYLPFFGSNGFNKIVIVRVNPESVVAVPKDYDNAKMRVYRYEVIGELTKEQSAEILDAQCVIRPGAGDAVDGVEWGDNADDYDDPDDYDYDPDDYVPDDDDVVEYDYNPEDVVVDVSGPDDVDDHDYDPDPTPVDGPPRTPRKSIFDMFKTGKLKP